LVDDKPASNLEQRSKILSEREGIALRAEKLFEINKEEGRELIKPYRIIYIYHDRIDSTGDTALMKKPAQSQMVILGDMSLGGSIVPADNIAETLQVALDSGAKRLLLPMSSVGDIQSIPGELFAKFQTSFSSDPVDAVFKGLGVE
jgi:hypothetical protein